MPKIPKRNDAKIVEKLEKDIEECGEIVEGYEAEIEEYRRLLDGFDTVKELLQEFPGEQYDLVERVKELIKKATGERPI